MKHDHRFFKSGFKSGKISKISTVFPVAIDYNTVIILLLHQMKDLFFMLPHRMVGQIYGDDRLLALGQGQLRVQNIVRLYSHLISPVSVVLQNKLRTTVNARVVSQCRKRKSGSGFL